MIFTSDSVIFNKGKLYEIGVDIPHELDSFFITDEIWQVALEKLNNLIKSRSKITTILEDVKIDILKIYRKDEKFLMEVVIREEDIKMMNNIKFLLTGHVIFEDDTEVVEQVIINDVIYDGDRKLFSEKI